MEDMDNSDSSKRKADEAEQRTVTSTKVQKYESATICDDLAMKGKDSESDVLDLDTLNSHKVIFNFKLMKKIFEYLELHDRNNFSMVCKQWRVLAHEYSEEEPYYHCDRLYSWLGKTRLMEDIKLRHLTKNILFNASNYREHDLDEIIDFIVKYMEDIYKLSMYYPNENHIKKLFNRYSNFHMVSVKCNEIVLKQLFNLSKTFSALKSIYIDLISTKCHIDFPDVFSEFETGLMGLECISISVRSNKYDTLYFPVDATEKIIVNRKEKLTQLSLDISDSIPMSLNDCSRLKELNITMAQIKKFSPLGKLEDLEYLDLTVKDICEKEELISFFEYSLNKTNFPKLKSLKVTLEKEQEDIGLLQIVAHNLRSVETINLKNVDINSVQDQLVHLLELYCLRSLTITGAKKIDRSSVCFISKAKSLQELRMEPCNLKGDDVAELNSLKNLKRLTLRGCDFTIKIIAKLLNDLPDLIHLSIPDCGLKYSDISAIKGLLSGQARNIYI